MSDLVSIKNLPKEEVLKALYDNAKTQGLGILHYRPEPMTICQAKSILKEEPRMSFDYLIGRVMKVNISGDEIDPWGYDMDNGEGSVQKVISKLRNNLNISE